MKGKVVPVRCPECGTGLLFQGGRTFYCFVCRQCYKVVGGSLEYEKVNMWEASEAAFGRLAKTESRIWEEKWAGKDSPRSKRNG